MVDWDYKKMAEERAARLKKEREKEMAEWVNSEFSLSKTSLTAICDFLDEIETQTAGSLEAVGYYWKARERIDINDNPIIEFSAEPADRERQDHWCGSDDDIEDYELYDDWQTTWASPLDR